MSISAYFKFQNLIIIGLFIFSAAVTPLLSILINYALSVFPQTKSGIVSAMINLFRQIGAIFSMAFMSFMAYYGSSDLIKMSDIGFSLAVFYAVALSLLGCFMASKLSINE
jgi:hypothetical protein